MDGENESSSGTDAIVASSAIYATLPEADAIRLLELYPASQHGMPLIGRIVVTTLRSCRDDLVDRYTALSYVWGNPVPTDSLTVDDGHGDLGMTSNLATALRDIRHASVSLTLWVDAICINQGDLTERARQVRIMGEIYATAGSTIIYLGSPAPGLEVLFETVQAKANARLGIKTTVETEIPQTLAHAIEQFCSYDWFGRSWVFQELVLSNDPRVQCGRMRARWTEILQIVTETALGAQEGYLATSSRLPRAMDETRGSSNPKHRTMANLIRARAGSYATDPRDYFFSLMGLMSDQGKVGAYFQVDYRQAVRDVYVAAATYALGAMGLPNLLGSRFDPLWSSVPTPTSPLRAALPSWVPDWSIQTPWTPAWAKAEEERLEGSASSSFLPWGSSPMVFRGRLTLPVIQWQWREQRKHGIPPDLDRIEEISAILVRGSEYPIAEFEKLHVGFLELRSAIQPGNVYYLRDGWVRPLGAVVLDQFPHDFSLLVPERDGMEQDPRLREWYPERSQDAYNDHSLPQGRPTCRLALLALGHLHVVPADTAVGDFVFDTIDLGQRAGRKFVPHDGDWACCVVGRPLRPRPGDCDDDDYEKEKEDAEIAQHMAKVWGEKLQELRDQVSHDGVTSLSGLEVHELLHPRDINVHADQFAQVQHFRLVGFSQAQPEYNMRTVKMARGVAVIH
ncbi:hypothetical protein PG997_011572 [Apiospora hydei]|uniref:Heterokaryon incompatibility domain-containing protein n=1 Tax=Apiospora hydei TaxID=1337664 RepID=A0ABR1VJF2_9PEZI